LCILTLIFFDSSREDRRFCTEWYQELPELNLLLLSSSVRPTALTYKHRELNDRPCYLVVRVSGYRSRGRGFNSRRYQVFWLVVFLERNALSLMRKTEVLLERKMAAPVKKTKINGRGEPLRCLRDIPLSAKLALTSPRNGCRPIDMVRLRSL
jgi:hypothetical protein